MSTPDWDRLIAEAAAIHPLLAEAVAEGREICAMHAEAVAAGQRAQQLAEDQRRGISVMDALMREEVAAARRAALMLEQATRAGERARIIREQMEREARPRGLPLAPARLRRHVGGAK